MDGILTPKSTLYVGNIDWSIKKQALRRALYMLFSRHGTIIDVIVLRSPGLRGQGWVLFEDVVSATAALRAENNVKFFGKELRVGYAKETSDVIARRDGTYIPKAKRQKMAQEQATRKAAEKSDNNEESGGAGEEEKKSSENEDTEEHHQAKKLKSDEPLLSNEPQAPPSNILFAQNLPKECSSSMLSMLFRQYTGFKECRMPREGIAFVEFADESQATLAKQNLDGFKLTAESTLDLVYSKK
jgi:U2 small nuclear ribonucleoprotein B''